MVSTIDMGELGIFTVGEAVIHGLEWRADSCHSMALTIGGMKGQLVVEAIGCLIKELTNEAHQNSQPYKAQTRAGNQVTSICPCFCDIRRGQ